MKYKPKNQMKSDSTHLNNYFIYYIIGFILLIVIIFILIDNSGEYFGRIRFLDKKETSQFFKLDKDDYIKNLTIFDVKAQKSKSKKDYQNKIIESADSFTPEERIRIEKACKRADDALEKINIPGFDGVKASNLDWNLALTRGRKYEDGLPHTRLDTIFLSELVLGSSDDQMAKTMLHEKVHVYERLFPEDIEVWMKTQGYKPYKKWSDFKIARSNPDINDWSYLDPNGKPMVVLYKTDNPKSIHEVTYSGMQDPSNEHPYETLAYTLEEYL
jgi:hypothetical protein